MIVLLISTDSFGSSGELLKGRTPPARGVFTDDLNRARHQLAAAFEMKTNGMSPVAAGTDVLGALWRVKSLLETGRPTNTEREIWIFSDLMNETPALPMPVMIATGSENILEKAKKNGLIVPLHVYKIRVVGASTHGLSPNHGPG